MSGIAKTYENFKSCEDMFQCPLCAAAMALREENSFVCANGHCFDLSKRGYVNFAPNQGRTKYTKALFESRRAIFEAGFYDPLIERIKEVVDRYYDGGAGGDTREPSPCANESAATVLRTLDAGCGEGFFARRLAANRRAEAEGQVVAGRPAVGGQAIGGQTGQMFALDIAKEAIAYAAKGGGHNIKWIVGDLTNMPLRSKSIDILYNILAPANYGEFDRIVRKEGLIVKVIPGHAYLQELRQCAGDSLLRKTYSNEAVLRIFEENVTCLEKSNLSYQMPLTDEQETHFFAMTPLMLNVDVTTLAPEVLGRITIEVEILVGRMST